MSNDISVIAVFHLPPVSDDSRVLNSISLSVNWRGVCRRFLASCLLLPLLFFSRVFRLLPASTPCLLLIFDYPIFGCLFTHLFTIYCICRSRHSFAPCQIFTCLQTFCSLVVYNVFFYHMSITADLSICVERVIYLHVNHIHFVACLSIPCLESTPGLAAPLSTNTVFVRGVCRSVKFLGNECADDKCDISVI